VKNALDAKPINPHEMFATIERILSKVEPSPAAA